MVICQLSTNDATNQLPLGDAIFEKNPDTSTVAGAIMYIIDYVKQTWDCPIVFYTGSYYESEHYAKMVDMLKIIGERLDVGVIDLYTDKEFNNISDEQRELYMADPIHPTKAGYLEWWTPKMEEYLYEFVSEKVD
jgi:lysophospholipase L1-like esterase